MEESSQSDKEFEWDHLNIEKKHELCVQLLKKTKREKSVLFVKNKNLKNTIKNMEIELCKIKDALRVEECKFLQLYEKLNTKTRERLESKAREERLSESVDILHSRLQREISRRELLEEKIKMATQERPLLGVVSQRLTQVTNALRRTLGRRRNSVRDENHST